MPEEYVITKWIYARQDGKHNVIIWCPKCGLRAGLDHDISASGIVSPSVVCPHDGCEFHENVRLEGYPDQPDIGGKDALTGIHR